jgi:hypothetical protein
MKWLILLALSVDIYSAELNAIKVKGVVSSFSDSQICLSYEKTKTCFKRKESLEYLVKSQGYVEVAINRGDLLDGVSK